MDRAESVAPGARREPRVFYGWAITACAFLSLFVSSGLTFGGITVFDESLLREFGWSRGALKFRDMLTMTLGGLLAPFAGAIADRFGVKWPMVCGAVLLAGSLLLYGQIGSAAHMYGVHVLFAVVLAGSGVVMAVMLVSRWFVKRRGTATGLALVGTSLGGATFPVIGAWLIEHYGWRHGLMALAVFPALAAVILVALLRERPGDVGLQPYGETPGAGGPSPASTGLDFREAVRTRTFWLIAGIGAASFYAILGISANVFLHLRAQGFDVPTAARGLFWLFFLSLMGKMLFGLLADRFDHTRVLMLNLVMMLAGSAALASMRPAGFWPFVVCFGLGWGGIYTLLQLLTVDAFGLKAAGRVLGTRTVLDAFGAGLGPWVTGVLFDWTGTYQVAFVVVSALILATLVAATALRIESPAPPVAAGGGARV